MFPGTLRIVDGWLTPNEAPGWGIDLDLEAAARYPAQLSGHDEWAAGVRRLDGALEARDNGWSRSTISASHGQMTGRWTWCRTTRSSRRAGANQYDLGSFNEAVIIETIRLAGIISRTEISRRTGLTQQSVSRILRILLQQGLLVEEAQERAERLGKPRTPVRLRSNAAHAVGIHIDPELLTVAVVDLDGTIVRRETVDLAADLDAVQAGRSRRRHGDRGARASARWTRARCSASASPYRGRSTPTARLLDLPLQPAWRGLEIRQLLQQKLNHPVLVEKDGTAAAIGERWIGRSARARDFAYLYLGTGVGSGLILNGSIYRGGTANAGEFGQIVRPADGGVGHRRPGRG